MKAVKIILLLLRIIGIVVSFLVIVYMVVALANDNINSPFEILKNIFK
jgi:hypothetical protein